MNRLSLSRLLPVVGGAVAGGAIALAVASGGGSHTTTTTVVRQNGLPTSFSANRGLSVNQVYRQAGPGVVDITVSSANNGGRSEEHTSELQSHVNLVCRLLLEKKKKKT